MAYFTYIKPCHSGGKRGALSLHLEGTLGKWSSMRSVLFCLLIGWFSSLHAAGAELDLAEPHFAIGNAVSVYEDADATMTLAQIRALPEERFVALGRPTASHTFTRSAFWYRFAVVNHGPQAVSRLLWLNQPWLHSTDFAIIAADGTQTRLAAGNGLPYAARAIAHPLLNVRHDFAPGRSDVYLRVSTPDPFIVTLNLTDERHFLLAQLQDGVLVALVYGAILSMLLYNLLLYFGIREPYQFCYVLYLSSFLLMNAAYNNYTFALWFADNPQAQDWMQSGAIFSFLCAGLLFTRSFLDLQLQQPGLYRLTTRFLQLVLLLALLTPWLGYPIHVELAIILSSLVSFYSFALGLYCWCSGNRSARFFLLGSVSGLIGTMVTAFTVMAFLPFHYLTYKALDFGLMVDGILMSLALADRVKLVREEKLRAELASRTDALTGLQNRRAYEEVSQREEERLKRYGGDLSVIMLDINRFKQVNDIHGHACGDALLRQVSARIRHHIRSNDHAFRMGGDEFLILLPNTDREQAILMAERLRQIIADKPILFHGKALQTSISLGVAQYRSSDNALDGLLRRADEAMYLEKHHTYAAGLAIATKNSPSSG